MRRTSIADWIDELRGQLSTKERLVVGLVGPPGAGKSTLADRMARELGAVIAPMDGFHLPNVELDRLGRRDRKGAPDTFDATSFVEHVDAVVRADSDVSWPGFDRTIDEPVPGAHTIRADAALVVVEGNYLLLDDEPWSRLDDLLDMTAWIDLDDEVRLRRLLARHEEFGRSAEEAQRFAYGSDEANAALIAPGRSRASVVLSAPR